MTKFQVFIKSFVTPVAMTEDSLSIKALIFAQKRNHFKIHLSQEAGMVVWAVSLVLVVTWQISAWEGLSPNALGNIVTLTRPGLLRVPAMLAGSLISYR